MDKPLVLTRDHELAGELDRLAAAASCTLHTAPDLAAARAGWTLAPLVLVDAVALAECTAARLARRPNVVVLCRGEPPPATWRQAMHIGAERVVVLPDGEPWLVGVLADTVEGDGRCGRVIAVIGGRGGAGASVFAAALAMVALRRTARALLVDCDPIGGGLDLLLGIEHADGLRWPELAVGGGRVPAAELHAALPSVPIGSAGTGPPGSPDRAGVPAAGLAVLACGRSGEPPEAEAVGAVIDAGRRTGDTVVCDLPRHLPEPARAALERADLVTLVVPAEVRACASAAPIVHRLRQQGCQIRVIVRGPAPGGLAPADVSKTLAVPLLTAMRPAPGLAAALEAGRLPVRGALARAATAVLDTVSDGAE